MRSNDNDSLPDANPVSDEEKIGLLVARYVDVLNRGDDVDPDRVRRDHPDSAPEILEQLETFVECTTPLSVEEPLGTLGDYTLRRQIGRGGMGVVYEAWQESMNRQVALKVLPVGISADRKAFTRFMREAQTAGQLNHQNVVAVYSTGVEEGTPWYSMEYVEGETLGQVLREIKEAEPEAKTPFGPKDQADYYIRLARAFADVADGLQHAHSKGVIHRDIKPSNLILDGEGRLRILDFGLAHLEGQESLTLSGDVVGTPSYMSPEQARAKKDPIDHRTDVYSLGATMYEALTLRPPFKGKSHQDTLSQIIERDPVEPRKVNPRVPRDLETVVLKCLRKDRADRYGTAEAAAQDLRRFVRHDPIEARPERSWEKIARAVSQRKERVVFMALVFFLLLAAGLILYRYHEDQNARLNEKYDQAVLGAVVKLRGAGLGLAADTRGRSRIRNPGLITSADFTRLSREGIDNPLESSLRILHEAADAVPGRPEAYFYQAQALALLGRLDDAERTLDQALANDPGFLPASALWQELKGEAAGADGSRGEQTTSDAWQTWLQARRALAEARWDAAIAACTQLIEQEDALGERYLGSSLSLRLDRGRARLEAGQYTQAQEDFVILQHTWPDYLEPALLLGRAYLLNGQEPDAERTFIALHEAAQTARKKDEVALWVGAVYRNEQAYAAGLNWAEKIQNDALRARSRSSFLFNFGQYEAALTAAEEATSLDPTDPLAWCNVAGALNQLGKPEDAFTAASKALELKPDLVQAHFNRAIAWKKLRNYPNAVSELKRIITLNPSYWYAWSELAINLDRAGEHEEAKAVCRTAIARDIRVSLLRCYLGHLLLEEGSFEEAEKELRLGIAEYVSRRSLSEIATRDCAWYRVKLGTVLERRDAFSEAFAQYHAALDLKPKHTYIHRALARLGHREDRQEFDLDWDGLLRALGEQLESLSDDAWALQTLALARMHARDSRNLEKALELASAAKTITAEDFTFFLTLAEAQYLNGQREAAVRTLAEGAAAPDASPLLQKRLEEYFGNRRSE